MPALTAWRPVLASRAAESGVLTAWRPVLLLDTVAAVKRELNPRLAREGVLITMADLRTRLSRDVEAQAREVFGRDVFETVIPRNVRLAEAPSYGVPIQHFDASCRGARAYTALAAELVGRHTQRVPMATFRVAK